MASSSSATSTTASSSSSHPPRPFVRPLFLGKPLNPPLLRPAAATAADRVVTVANPAGYIRNTSPTAVMTFSTAATPQPRPFVLPPTAAADPAGAHLMPPPGPHHFSVPRRSVGGAQKTAPAAAAPKAAPFPAASLAPESSNFKDSGRERSREDALVMICGRKNVGGWFRFSLCSLSILG
ncbi:uncharacterized protein M6B38_180650 [Iris pallida]|uniref:Uncharacterized protein n=1 Tax=Iris pallida TaxID=29817 RepID=A0AAX6ENK0_IRIPA|nr:uncharacterized protein M6B38_180650 [Iris pallida]